jgi:hypothetical protein
VGGDGGSITIQSGSGGSATGSTSSQAGSGGNIVIKAGAPGTASGGTQTQGTAGTVKLQTVDAGTTGIAGDIILQGGSSDTGGGNVILQGGSSSSVPGTVIIQQGTSQNMTFNTDYTMTTKFWQVYSSLASTTTVTNVSGAYYNFKPSTGGGYGIIDLTASDASLPDNCIITGLQLNPATLQVSGVVCHVRWMNPAGMTGKTISFANGISTGYTVDTNKVDTANGYKPIVIAKAGAVLTIQCTDIAQFTLMYNSSPITTGAFLLF